jgi:hypothetical protein
MQNVDKEKVKKVVYDISKDSAHFQNEQRKQVCAGLLTVSDKKRICRSQPSQQACRKKFSRELRRCVPYKKV